MTSLEGNLSRDGVLKKIMTEREPGKSAEEKRNGAFG